MLDLQTASTLLSAPAKTLAPFPTPPAAAVLLDEAFMLDLQMAAALLSAPAPMPAPSLTSPPDLMPAPAPLLQSFWTRHPC